MLAIGGSLGRKKFVPATAGTLEAARKRLDELAEKPDPWLPLDEMPHIMRPFVWHAAYKLGLDWDRARMVALRDGDRSALRRVMAGAHAMAEKQRAGRRPAQDLRAELIAAALRAVAGAQRVGRNDLAHAILRACDVDALPVAELLPRAARRAAET